MAWIEVRTDVLTHPKTMTLQELLPLSDRETLGLLCSLWFYAMNRADGDGLLKGVTPAMLAKILKSPQRDTGEVEALISSGFLDKTDEGLRVHNWRSYSGRLAEAKERDRLRKARKKVLNNFPMEFHGIPRVQDSTVHNSTQQDRTEEDRTEQDRTEEDSLYGGEAAGAPKAPETRKRVYSEEFETFWKQYPRKIAKPEAAKAFAKMVSPEDMDELIRGVNTWNYSEQWLRDNGRYIPHAATFLHREQWRDNPKLDRPDEEYRPPVVTTNF